MIDESDFKLWNESPVTKLFFKFITNGNQKIKDFVTDHRDFRMDACLKENYLKGLVDGYTKCLNVSLDELKIEEEEEKK